MGGVDIGVIGVGIGVIGVGTSAIGGRKQCDWGRYQCVLSFLPWGVEIAVVVQCGVGITRCCAVWCRQQ